MKTYKLLYVLVVLSSIYISAMGNKNKKHLTTQQAMKIMSDSNLNFAANFFKAVSPTQENTVCSPISAQMTLGLATLGAKGQTAEQMCAAMNLKPNRGHANLQAFKTFLHELKSQNGKGTNAKLVNWIFLREGLSLRPKFMKLANRGFNSEPKLVNFTNPDTITQINNDVSQYTKGKINDMIQPGSFDGNTVAVLVNAIYFKGKWKKEFDLVESYNFNAGTSQLPVSMNFLNTKSDFRLEQYSDLKISAIQIPYQADKLSFVILLPDRDSTLASVETQLDSETLAQTLIHLTQATPKSSVEVYIPKFKLETAIDLKVPLQTMGMTDMFDSTKADFTGLLDTPHDLWVSKVAQKTFIEISEQGTEAASGTYLQVQSRMYVERTIFKANRPFLFYLILQATDSNPVILFSGRFVSPP